MEYKSPNDYLSIDDFYKVYAYCCLYKSMAEKQNGKKAEDITITFICGRYPEKLIKHLKLEKQMQVVDFDKGIYYLNGDIFPMQLIVTSRLSEETNLWLKNITNHLEERDTVEKLIEEYQKHEQEELYQSVMNIIIHANFETFKEENNMLEVLEELFKDKLEEKKEVGREQGEIQNLLKLIQKKLQKGKSYDEIADELETDLYVVEQICEVLSNATPDTTQEQLVNILMSKNLLKEEIISV